VCGLLLYSNYCSLKLYQLGGQFDVIVFLFVVIIFVFVIVGRRIMIIILHFFFHAVDFSLKVRLELRM
jgi:hypothetical protein